MRFSLNVTPLVMKSIIDIVRSQEELAGRATLVYIDDVYVNESIMSAAHVRTKLAEYRLICRDPDHLKDEAHILELEVWDGNMTLCDVYRKQDPKYP